MQKKVEFDKISLESIINNGNKVFKGNGVVLIKIDIILCISKKNQPINETPKVRFMGIIKIKKI